MLGAPVAWGSRFGGLLSLHAHGMVESATAMWSRAPPMAGCRGAPVFARVGRHGAIGAPPPEPRPSRGAPSAAKPRRMGPSTALAPHRRDSWNMMEAAQILRRGATRALEPGRFMMRGTPSIHTMLRRWADESVMYRESVHAISRPRVRCAHTPSQGASWQGGQPSALGDPCRLQTTLPGQIWRQISRQLGPNSSKRWPGLVQFLTTSVEFGRPLANKSRKLSDLTDFGHGFADSPKF